MTTLARAKRFVYLLHRWTGVAGCVLMALWVLSGVVMLFVGYPKLLPRERLRALPVLDAASCCVPVERALAHSVAPSEVRQITLTSVGGRIIYRLREKNGALLAVDATSAKRIPAITERDALQSARSFLPGANARALGQVVDDRWTHSSALDAHRPLFKVQMDDDAATLLYVSSTTGEVVMDASRSQRAWNYVGAWLHWLYMFRDGSRDPVWSWLVIALSAMATLSAVTGALAGIWRWRFSGRYKSGAKTPYREFQMRWHHLMGLVFGVVLTTWIFSGLMSMNPAGVFDPVERPNLSAYQGGLPGDRRPSVTTAASLRLLSASGFAAREIEWRVLAGDPFIIARNGAGETRLISVIDGQAQMRERWDAPHLQQAAQRLMQAPAVSTVMLTQYDHFYYRRQEASMYAADPRGLPALRLDFADAARRTVYIDMHTGEVALSADRAQRASRWLFNLLHSWDLPTFLEYATTRVAALVTLSTGGLVIALTGMVIGWRRVKIFVAQRALSFDR